MSNIWSPKIPNGMYQACCKIPYKGYEISIAMDDSCGTLPTLSRSDIRVFLERNGEDVTDKFQQTTIVATADALKKLFSWIDMFGERD